MQLVNVSDLPAALAQYMDPDGNTFGEEIAVYTELLQAELAKVPHVKQVVFWDSENGGDPELDLSLQYIKRELVPTPPPSEGVYVGEQAQGARWAKSGGSYYGATYYQRDYCPVGQFVISLWFGGSPLNSAGGFCILPVG
jgi:hypothetical protein